MNSLTSDVNSLLSSDLSTSTSDILSQISSVFTSLTGTLDPTSITNSATDSRSTTHDVAATQTTTSATNSLLTTDNFATTRTTTDGSTTTTSGTDQQSSQGGLTSTATSNPPTQPTTSQSPDGAANLTTADASSTSLLTATGQNAGTSSTADPGAVTNAVAQANGSTPATPVYSVTTSSQLGNETATFGLVPSTTASSTSTAWLPTALVTAATTVSDPSPQATGSDQSAAAQATGSANTPTIITPANGIPETPPNSTLVRIGFTQSLNYPFVVQNSVTVAQIFQFLPVAGSYALQIGGSDVTVRSLEPYAVSQYIATSALIFIPQDQVDNLQVQILATNSRLYSQSDPTAQQLVNAIDPTIPLLADTSSSGSTNSNGGAGASGGVGFSNQGAIGGSLDNSPSQDITSSSSSSGKEAAIGIGAALAAIVYAALMFLGARRFRKQSTQAQLDRHHHSRVSSITGERSISPPFSHSSRSSGSSGGRSLRGQNISAPLMTENTLLL